MQAAGTLRDANLTIVLTGDEERPGAPVAVARRDLIAAGRAADYALEFENLARDGGREFGTIARRSSTSWTLRASGRTGHSSGVFGEGLGYGAIYEMARILDAFRRELPEPNLTYNVGVIAGGTPATIDEAGFRAAASGKTNIVAETAIARGDIRTLSAEQDQRVRAAMQAIVGRHLPRTGAELVFAEDGYPPMAPTEGNRALLARLNAANRDLGLPEMAEYDPARRGAADFGLRRRRRRHSGRPRRRRRQRPCDGRMGRSRHNPPPGQARRRADQPANGRVALSSPAGTGKDKCRSHRGRDSGISTCKPMIIICFRIISSDFLEFSWPEVQCAVPIVGRTVMEQKGQTQAAGGTSVRSSKDCGGEVTMSATERAETSEGAVAEALKAARELAGLACLGKHCEAGGTFCHFFEESMTGSSKPISSPGTADKYEATMTAKGKCACE